MTVVIIKNVLQLISLKMEHFWFFFSFWFKSKNALSSEDTVEFLFVAPCAESNQGDCSNQRLPYLQDLSTVNSQELIRADKDDQNKSRHQC